MKRVEAVGILKSLVEGRDPASGDELPVESVLQRAPVLRALLMAQTELEESVQRATTQPIIRTALASLLEDLTHGSSRQI